MRKEEVAILATSDYLKDSEDLALLRVNTTHRAGDHIGRASRADFIYAFTKYYKHKDYFVAYIQTADYTRIPHDYTFSNDIYPARITQDFEQYVEFFGGHYETIEDFINHNRISRYFVKIGPDFEDFATYKKISHRVAFRIFQDRTFNPYQPIYPRKGDIYGKYHKGFYTLQGTEGSE